MIDGFKLLNDDSTLGDIYTTIFEDKNVVKILYYGFPYFDPSWNYTDEQMDEIERIEVSLGDYAKIWNSDLIQKYFQYFQYGQSFVMFYTHEPKSYKVTGGDWDLIYYRYDGVWVELYSNDKEISLKIIEKYEICQWSFPGSIESDFFTYFNLN